MLHVFFLKNNKFVEVESYDFTRRGVIHLDGTFEACHCGMCTTSINDKIAGSYISAKTRDWRVTSDEIGSLDPNYKFIVNTENTENTETTEYTYEQRVEYYNNKINNLKSKLVGGMESLLINDIMKKNDKIQKQINKIQSRLNILNYRHSRGWI